MDKTQAKLFFNCEEGEEPYELWEQKLFEHKQFFLTRPPIFKVFTARLKKLKKIQEAYFILTEQKLSEIDEKIVLKEVEFPELVVEAFHLQQQYRMKMKQLLLQSVDFNSLANAIHQWLLYEKAYMTKWKQGYIENTQDIVVSKEPDPMELLAAFRVYEKDFGPLTFEKVKKDQERLPKMILNESKRLNLLFDKSYGG